ncbi:hypothetical protein GCM10008944_25870 [Cytobacillus oceanisediminis]
MFGHRNRTQRRSERGTSTLEVVGVVPLVVIVIMLLAQVALSLYAITTAQTAVRQAARAESQGSGTATTVLNESLPGWLEVGPGDVQTFGPGHGVRARFDVPDLVPFFDLSFTRESVMP